MTRHCLQFRGGLLAALLFIFMLLLLLGLSGLPAAAQDAPLPAAPGDAARGLEIYQARCANCHGPQGGGDGELAPQSPMPPAVFADPAYRLTAVPTEMYLTIVNGRMDQGMPPFGPGTQNPLSEQDVWDAIAAIYAFSTPSESLETGAGLYAEVVDESALPALTEPGFWATQSNEAVLVALQQADALTAADLAEADLQAIVDYARSSYGYVYNDPRAQFAPISAAIVQGEVRNGTTDELVGNVTATLRAFTRDVQETMTMTTTVGADGRYVFELNDVPADWIYLVAAEYNGTRFNSQPAILERALPELDLPVTVYENSSDPSPISIAQLHVILNFVADQVQISQLYRFDNLGNALFVGPTGNPQDGTVEIVLPAGAQNVEFQRGFGDLSNFVLANEVVQTDTGWADTLPLWPGRASLDLLVSYELPYQNGMRIAHPLNYPVGNASAILPDAGVSLQEGGWQLQGQQAMGEGVTFVSYTNPEIGGADTLNFTLNGRPRQTASLGGSSLAVRNETSELIVGSIGLLVVVGAAVYLISAWRSHSTAVAESDPDALLQALAELDEAFENGEIDQADYEEEREALKLELIELWTDEP